MSLRKEEDCVIKERWKTVSLRKVEDCVIKKGRRLCHKER